MLMFTQEYERAREHCSDLEQELSETRGQLNDKDRVICQMELVRVQRSCSITHVHNYIVVNCRRVMLN